ncbi:hypothetical protein M9H77_25529 [Catharanthus roseus]|uniref:Uncharacterized protein n=1 Tax=Catharanthus roseus TaxID=4058 RepID=A0ACC0A823_CATRO|nr:hypothetical protein M9H77_25529 [Catharanthus roseus]
MERNKQLAAPPPCPPQPQAAAEELNGAGIYVKVMTDEQIELLGKQIAAYATISEQLEELHRSLCCSQNDDQFSGGLMRIGNPYSTSLMASNSSQKLSRRQRWNPTPDQLHILERVFDKEGIKTPNPQKVKEITAELANHGQISEPNVYNWFQNRRARLKKKQMIESESNNEQSGEADHQKVVVESLSGEEFCQQNDVVKTGRVVNTPHCLQGCLKPIRDFTKMPIQGRISWEDSHNNILLNTENYKNTADIAWWPNIS